MPTFVIQEEQKRERGVILAVLYGELLRACSDAKTWVRVVREYGVDQLLEQSGLRDGAAEMLRTIDMPLSKSLIGRLHVLPALESATIARALGIVTLLHQSEEALRNAAKGSFRAEEIIERIIREAEQLSAYAASMTLVAERVVYPNAVRTVPL